MAEKNKIHVFVSGRVQGVFFRAGTRKKARELGLTGWVKNLPDGRVETVLEGEKEAVKKMTKWFKHGPPLARVNNVEIKQGSFGGEFQDFRIRR